MRKQVELLIDEDELTGIEAVSLVRFPAIEENWVYLSATQDAKMLFATDEEKQMLIGPALIPEKLIMRLDDENEEYDVFFSKETVRQAMELFMQEARTNEHTLEHNSKIDGVTVVESWLVEDEKKDKSALYGFKLPVGTWMLSVKVNNPQIWEKVKKQEVRGFSIEGYFTDRLVEMQKGKLCKNCPEDAEIMEKLKAIILDELKPSTFLNDRPLFTDKRTAELWGQMFHDVSGFEKVTLNGEILYSANYKMESYDWDKCISEQTAEYGSKEIAEKVCGAIRAKYG
jgi:hypothetical protein